VARTSPTLPDRLLDSDEANATVVAEQANEIRQLLRENARLAEVIVKITGQAQTPYPLPEEIPLPEPIADYWVPPLTPNEEMLVRRFVRLLRWG
jgi:hypothetical protein